MKLARETRARGRVLTGEGCSSEGGMAERGREGMLDKRDRMGDLV